MHSKQEQETLVTSNTLDRISQLNNDLLCEILSHVSTKNAVATSILSTRWKNLFQFGSHPIVLDLYDTELLHAQENKPNSLLSTSFTRFVDKLLNETLRNEPCVFYMTISCYRRHYGDAKFVSWVSAALRLNVKHLLLTCYLIESKTLFFSLNGCKTLTRLGLGGKYSLSIPDNFSLPNLERLDLCRIVFRVGDEELINRLVVSCPSLLELHLNRCDLQLLLTLYIKSPVLINLFVEKCNWDDAICELTLDVPKLEQLFLIKCFADFYSNDGFECLRCAYIDAGPSSHDNDEEDDVPWDNLDRLVTDCFRASNLFLSRWSLEALQSSVYSQLPTFQNLAWLSLGCISESRGWAVLACLLRNAPNLKKLQLQEGFKECEDGYASFEQFVSTPLICLEQHLKEIEVWVFDEKEDEIKLVEYLLNNGKVLEKFKINFLPFKDWGISFRLAMLPAGKSKLNLK